ncbi:MAG: putative DNA-directed polymerase, partial [Candidatus Saccharibacteria bacterium]|nr:putative DNA-directed polymerase [Candidatus Saccharibacteria bacterium]
MNDTYNTERPLIMHIDLNSCFATVEQQARPMLRGRPVAIVNRRTEHTMIVTASYEAKERGVTLGMRLRDAKLLCPDLIGLESDPAKYRYVYHKMMDIMRSYSAHVTMKSIDEGVIDFHETSQYIRDRPLEDIGREIKQRLRDEIGVAMRCNVGIATNRFLAKTAANLHKPDGLDVITHDNVRQVMTSLKLMDLTGIAHHNEARLNSVGIYTPLEFLDCDKTTLEKVVFKSIVGEQWHQRLRGWEVDDRPHPLKTAGRQYVLESNTLQRTEILQRLHHLCESVGAKIRSQGKVARGVFVYAKSVDRRYWHARRMAAAPFFSNSAIYAQAYQLFELAPQHIKEIGVTCYELSDDTDQQLSLFGDELAQEKYVTSAIDEINGRYGDRTIHSADTLGTDIYVKQKIP